LNAIYDQILTHNIFEKAENLERSPLGKLIEDYDGKNKKILSTFMSEEDGESVGESKVDERYENCESLLSFHLISFFLVENWIRNQLLAGWSTVLSTLTKFSLKLDKKGSTDKLQTDGVEATLEATTSLLLLLMKLREFRGDSLENLI
jgi:hypothetical protein